MRKQQVIGCVLLLIVTAAAALWAKPWVAAPTEDAYDRLLASAPMAEVEGTAVSPDGRYTVRTAGRTDLYSSGYVVPETLQVVDADGTILWEDQGYLRQRVSWSPSGRYLALACSGRTWTEVRFLETESWSSWTFRLPDGSAIPEYASLPENWCDWLKLNDVLVTVGEGDGAEMQTCRVILEPRTGPLTAYVLEQTSSVLAGTWDFTHDGIAETLELMEVGGNTGGWYELWIRQEGSRLCHLTASTAHTGWRSLLAVKADGQDYLINYGPSVGQGVAFFQLEIYYLGQDGVAQEVDMENLDFDVNFELPDRTAGFDAETIAAFLEKAAGWMEGSIILLSTFNGQFRSGDSGGDFWKETGFWGEMGLVYDEECSILENVKKCEQQLRTRGWNHPRCGRESAGRAGRP